MEVMRRQKVTIHRSDAFKMAVVGEYQRGRINKNALYQKYGIGSHHARSGRGTNLPYLSPHAAYGKIKYVPSHHFALST
jgi:hypothetical protein